jgi:hypothetical protein
MGWRSIGLRPVHRALSDCRCRRAGSLSLLSGSRRRFSWLANARLNSRWSALGIAITIFVFICATAASVFLALLPGSDEDGEQFGWGWFAVAALNLRRAVSDTGGVCRTPLLLTSFPPGSVHSQKPRFALLITALISPMAWARGDCSFTSWTLLGTPV